MEVVSLFPWAGLEPRSSPSQPPKIRLRHEPLAQLGRDFFNQEMDLRILLLPTHSAGTQEGRLTTRLLLFLSVGLLFGKIDLEESGLLPSSFLEEKPGLGSHPMEG
jgi:hypothetical protein